MGHSGGGMKQGRRYIPLWHSLSGVVAAWQPIRAPDYLHARWNVGAHLALVGKYDAYVHGTAAIFDPRLGWTGTGSSHFHTGILPVDGWSMAACFAGGAYISSGRAIMGENHTGLTASFILQPVRGSAGDDHVYFQGAALTTGVRVYSGHMALSNHNCYLNGVADGTTGAWSGTTAYEIYLMAFNNNGTEAASWNGSLSAAVVYNRPLSADEIRLLYRQMTYCGQNPDWNAWASQRSVFIMPVGSGQVFKPYFAQQANTLLGGGAN